MKASTMRRRDKRRTYDTLPPSTPKPSKSNAAIGKFFIRIGQVQASQPWRDEWSDYIFPLSLILEAEGTLAEAAAHLAREAKPR